MGDNEMILPVPGVSVESWLGRCNGCDEHLSQLRAAEARQAVAVSRRAELEADRLEAWLEVTLPHLDDPSPALAPALRVELDGTPTTRAQITRQLPVMSAQSGTEMPEAPVTTPGPPPPRMVVVGLAPSAPRERVAGMKPGLTGPRPQRQGEVAVKLEGEPLLLTANPELIASEVASIYELARRPPPPAASLGVRAPPAVLRPWRSP